MDSWKYDKPVPDWPDRDEWTPHYYTTMIKNISNRNKLVFFKYKLKGDDTWHPVTDVINFGRLIQEDGAVKINSGDISEIRIKIEDKKNVKTIETVAIDYCK